MMDGQQKMCATIIVAMALAASSIILANVAAGAKCRSEAMAAGMQSSEVREACKL